MCHRLVQAWEIAKLLRGAVERGRFVIGVRPLSRVQVIVDGRFQLLPGFNNTYAYKSARTCFRCLGCCSSSCQRPFLRPHV
jgi:hypothetical protein